jgi:hypothetical protein
MTVVPINVFQFAFSLGDNSYSSQTHVFPRVPRQDSAVEQPRRPSSVQRNGAQRTASKLGYEREFNSTVLSLSEFPSFAYKE